MPISEFEETPDSSCASKPSAKAPDNASEGPAESSPENGDTDYYFLDPVHTDPARLKRERDKARKLKKSQWWIKQIHRGICHYCQAKFPSSKLTMDHVVPIARGGTSTQGNLVPACETCNRNKKLHTPVDQILKELKAEGRPKDRDGEGGGDGTGD